MRSLSLRSGNSPTTPYGGRVNGLQILGFPPPCHPNYRALALTPAGLSPAERASLCWTHVGIVLDVLTGLVPIIIDLATGDWFMLDTEEVNVALPVKE